MSATHLHSPPAEPQQDINPDPDLANVEDELRDALKEGNEEWEEALMLDKEGGEQEGPRETTTTTTTNAPTANDPVTGGVWVGEDVGPNYHQRLSQARETITGLLGKTVVKAEW